MGWPRLSERPRRQRHPAVGPHLRRRRRLRRRHQRAPLQTRLPERGSASIVERRPRQAFRPARGRRVLRMPRRDLRHSAEIQRLGTRVAEWRAKPRLGMIPAGGNSMRARRSARAVRAMFVFSALTICLPGLTAAQGDSAPAAKPAASAPSNPAVASVRLTYDSVKGYILRSVDQMSEENYEF